MRIIFITLFIFLFGAVQPVLAQESWIINALVSYLIIQTDGTVTVKESITVDFKSEEKHGIYRDIPYVYEDENGEKTYTEIAVLQVSQDGKNAEYKVDKNGTDLRIRIGDPDKTISGKHHYLLTYTATGVLRSFETHDELYWNATGNNWDVRIEKAVASVSVPGDKIEKVTCYYGYTGYQGECASEIIDTRTAVYTTRGALDQREGMTIVAGYTKGMVPILTVPPPKTLGLQDFINPVSIGAFLLAAVGGIVGVLWYWMKNGRDFWFKTRQILDPSARQETMPLGAHETTVVEFESPEKLRPAEIGVLMDERADTLDVTATIIDLATRGYLHITEEPKKWLFGTTDYELKKEKADENKLLSYEKMLLNRLFTTGDTVKLSALKQQFYDDLAAVKKSLYSDVMSKQLFAGNPENVRMAHAGAGFAVIFIGGLLIVLGANIIQGTIITFAAGLITAGLFLMIISQIMPRRTAKGRELFQRAKGYELFIGGAEKYRQQFFEKKHMFNEILPYAIVFGLTDKFAKAMKDLGLTPTQPTWYSGSRPFHTGYFVSDVNSFSKSMSSAIASTPSKSGGFSSGGSSGGGFGGGGGGSW
jgi:uncharacterized membrane protein